MNWLAEIIGSLLSWLPRLELVKTTHRGVRHGRRRAKLLEPGLHWWVPLIHEIQTAPVRRQTINLKPQTVQCKARAVTVSGTLTFEIVDVTKALLEVWDFDQTAADVAQVAIAEELSGRTVQALVEELSSGELSRKLGSKCRRALRGFGLRVLRCGLSDLSVSSVVRVVGDCGVAPLPEPDED